jgi:hypothetical protein
MDGFSEGPYDRKTINKIIKNELSNNIIDYLKKVSGNKNSYFSTITTTSSQGLETKVVKIYESGVLPFAVLSKKVCEINAQRQFHDAGDIEKIHEDGSVEYRIYSDANISAKTFDDKTINNTKLENIVKEMNYVDILSVAERGTAYRYPIFR